MQNADIVIVGGLGKTGGRVFEKLKSRGVKVRAASRSTNPAFDWSVRETWAPVLEGAEKIYVTYQPDLAVPRAADDIAAFASTARELGVKQVVLLSGRGEDGAVLSEDRLKTSGIGYTVLRAAWFFQNFSEGPFLDGIRSGELVLPVAEIGEPFVSADDIADVAVAVLTEPGHLGRTYELTGPQLLTFPEAVAEISAASGRDIAFIQVPFEAFEQELRKLGYSEEMIWLMEELFTRTLDGRNANVSDSIAQVLGHKPQSFSDFAHRAALDGSWRA